MRQALFLADWHDALFVHFHADARQLQPMIPFELDRWAGEAFVSLVAFRQKRLRFARGGRLAALLAAPLAQHEFLNLRTYIRVNEQPAIYFLAEWIPNRLAALIGPRAYGLPYRLGRLDYTAFSRRVVAGHHELLVQSDFDRSVRLEPSLAGSVDQFLLERYLAFTQRNGVARRFAVDHAPWPQTRATVRILDLNLIEDVAPWLQRADLAGANFSPGVSDVRISPPARVGAAAGSPRRKLPHAALGQNFPAHRQARSSVRSWPLTD